MQKRTVGNPILQQIFKKKGEKKSGKRFVRKAEAKKPKQKHALIYACLTDSLSPAHRFLKPSR